MLLFNVTKYFEVMKEIVMLDNDRYEEWQAFKKLQKRLLYKNLY